MAKNIKAIKCPNCGSVKKTEIKPDYFICQNCDTEYFLDNDDININYNQTPNVEPKRALNKIFILIAAVLVIVVVFAINIFSDSNKGNKSAVLTKKVPIYRFDSSYKLVYSNSKSGQPFLLRFGNEDVYEKNPDIEYKKVHAVYTDALTGKDSKVELMLPHQPALGSTNIDFYYADNGDIYLIYGKNKLFKLNRENNHLDDVTISQFKNHQDLNLGITEFSAYDDYLSILANDGNKYYYMPSYDILSEPNMNISENALSGVILKKPFRSHRTELVKNKLGTIGYYNTENFTPDRKYFNLKILYQDSSNIIICTSTNPSYDSPYLLQNIDAKSGKIIWSQPSRKIYYTNATKFSNGFAIAYTPAPEFKVFGAILITSPDGKVIKDYNILTP
ncbi:MAG: hypothetical protein ABIP95_10925 [Pelobium sp.]